MAVGTIEAVVVVAAAEAVAAVAVDFGLHYFGMD